MKAGLSLCWAHMPLYWFCHVESVARLQVLLEDKKVMASNLTFLLADIHSLFFFFFFVVFFFAHFAFVLFSFYL